MDSVEDKALNEVEDPRVRMAGERTLLAWVRTGLAMMGFGFVIARFGFILREMAGIQGRSDASPISVSLWIGATMVVLGVMVNIASAWQHSAFLRRLEAGEPYRPPAYSLGIIVSIVLALIGIGMTAYLFLIAS